MRIDMHSHVIPERVVAALAASPAEFAARVEGEGAARKVIHEQGYRPRRRCSITGPSSTSRSRRRAS
jgi:hypothetical protein